MDLSFKISYICFLLKNCWWVRWVELHRFSEILRGGGSIHDESLKPAAISPIHDESLEELQRLRNPATISKLKSAY
jgi:hypothetical protein